MGIEPGDWTVNSKLAALDPQLARALEIQHFTRLTLTRSHKATSQSQQLNLTFLRSFCLRKPVR
jgi:hypothetical protein